jgi:hypothetical protein
MLPEYDFSRGVRGKYADRFAKDTIMVVLDPDVGAIFSDRKSVNTALRALGHIVRDRQRDSARPAPQAEGKNAGRKRSAAPDPRHLDFVRTSPALES